MICRLFRFRVHDRFSPTDANVKQMVLMRFCSCVRFSFSRLCIFFFLFLSCSDPSSLLGVRLPPDTEIIKYTSSIVGPKNPGTTNRGRKKTISLDPNPLLATLQGLSNMGVSPAKRACLEAEYVASVQNAVARQQLQQQQQQVCTPSAPPCPIP